MVIIKYHWKVNNPKNIIYNILFYKFIELFTDSPLSPFSPLRPGYPGGPGRPGGPINPGGPISPYSPFSPFGPSEPCVKVCYVSFYTEIGINIY